MITLTTEATDVIREMVGKAELRIRAAYGSTRATGR